MAENYNISLSFYDFLKLSKDEFCGKLTDKHHYNHIELASNQTFAWHKEYDDLQNILQGRDGRILFEYSIPSLSKTIDVVLLMNGKIYVLEYKANGSEYKPEDIRQTNGYALRLKFFHSTSNNNWIVPILVATDAPSLDIELEKSEEDMVCKTILSNSNNLNEAINYVENELPSSIDDSWMEHWEYGIFKASPTIIDAARNVWKKNNVRDFSLGESDKDTRLAAEDYIVNTVVPQTKGRKEGERKSICFVTGVPGAGKTLVGLNISVALQNEGASMLSGNGPLVDVLTTALKRDMKDNRGNLVTEKDNISVETIIRSAYGYKKEIFEKRLDYHVGEGTVNLKQDAELGSQHIIIFDEAQRAWNKEKMIRPGQSGKKYWQESLFPFSEPDLLLWDMNQHDWGVFVCLVGGGQEIHDGEAGICEWLKALTSNDTFKGWHVYMADAFRGQEYDSTDGSGMTIESFRNLLTQEGRLIIDNSLHLTACQRSIRSEKVSNLIQAILNCDTSTAKSTYQDIKDKYHIYLTRDIDKAKEVLRRRRNQLSSLNHIRMGMLMSSNAKRLQPYGYPVGIKNKVASWFLDEEDNVQSSNFLEVALDEFSVQGLEIDIAAVMWDADFRYNPVTNCWEYYNFNGRYWSAIVDEKITGKEKPTKKEEKLETNRKRAINRSYLKNAYRVLLTRARTDMVIFVPDGSARNSNGELVDKTRDPAFYDSTYEYLKNIGIQEI